MKLAYITIKDGERHPMCLSLSAIEEICDEFGDLEEMADAIKNGTTGKKVRTINRVLKILMEAGRRYCREMGIDTPPALVGEPGDVIDITDGTAVRAIFEAISNDTQRTVEVREKNG